MFGMKNASGKMLVLLHKVLMEAGDITYAARNLVDEVTSRLRWRGDGGGEIYGIVKPCNN